MVYNDISVWNIEQCTYNNNCFIVTDKNNNNHIMNIVGLIIPQEQKKNIVLELDYLTKKTLQGKSISFGVGNYRKNIEGLCIDTMIDRLIRRLQKCQAPMATKRLKLGSG